MADFAVLMRMGVAGSADMTIRLWDIEHYYKLAKVVGAAKGGINFSGRQPLPLQHNIMPPSAGCWMVAQEGCWFAQ